MTMTYRFPIVLCVVVCLCTLLHAQDDASYLTPPQMITDMLLAKPTPGVSVDDNGEWMLLTEMDGYPPVEELARPELRLAGLRIDPNNYSPSRQRFIVNMYLQRITDGKKFQLSGLPTPLAASNISWSPEMTNSHSSTQHGNGLICMLSI